MSQKPKEEYTIVVVGRGGVGKTSITIQFCQSKFVTEYDPTIEEAYTKQLTVDGIPTLINIIDTAGQEGYEALRDQTIAGEADCYLLVYDITTPFSFEELKHMRVRILQLRKAAYYPMVYCGNKCDLKEYRQVSEKDGQNYVSLLANANISYPFFETSAKTRTNIQESFEEAVRLIRKFKSKNVTSSSSPTTKKQGKETQTRKCTIL